jgi:cytochrome P450
MTHPHALNKLTRELREQFSSAEEITAVAVNKCKYLLAIIEEGLRVYPPSPATHPRYTPPGGITIDDNFVPGNMAVGVTILAACVHEDNFMDGDKFIPERWTGEDSRFDGDNKQGSQPFSYGPRNCAGRNLAYLELKLIIASLVWHFDLENCHEGDWMDQKIYMVWQKGPLMVKLKPVKRS